MVGCSSVPVGWPLSGSQSLPVKSVMPRNVVSCPGTQKTLNPKPDDTLSAAEVLMLRRRRWPQQMLACQMRTFYGFWVHQRAHEMH